MCTAIAKKGNDLIYGFNLDIDPAAWNFALYRNDRYFTVGITVGRTLYFTHGVTAAGRFGNVPYMNGESFPVPRGMRRARLDQMMDRYIRGAYSFEDVAEITRTKAVVSVPATTLHALVGSERGELLIVEPGYGTQTVTEDYAVLTNFPLLAGLRDFSNPFYGKERYDTARSALRESGPDFSADDAMRLLAQVKQEGQWGTRISFAYSQRENAVHYCLNGDFSDLRIHRFAP